MVALSHVVAYVSGGDSVVVSHELNDKICCAVYEMYLNGQMVLRCLCFVS